MLFFLYDLFKCLIGFAEFIGFSNQTGECRIDPYDIIIPHERDRPSSDGPHGRMQPFRKRKFLIRQYANMLECKKIRYAYAYRNSRIFRKKIFTCKPITYMFRGFIWNSVIYRTSFFYLKRNLGYDYGFSKIIRQIAV